MNNTRDQERFVGLSLPEVEKNRQKHGDNIITPPPEEPLFKLFLSKFNDPIIKILIIAAIVSFIVGYFDDHYLESLGILSAIFLATTIAFINEAKAKKEFDILNQVRDEDFLNVIRDDGKIFRVRKKEIVVGDLVIIETGEEIPADGEIVRSISLQINESALTGESVPVAKYTKSDTERLKVNPRTFEAYIVKRGTFVTEGNGIVKIIAVGDDTELGKTTHAALESTGRETPLNIQLNKLSKLIGVVGFSIAILVFVILLSKALWGNTLKLETFQYKNIYIVVISLFIMLRRFLYNLIIDFFSVVGIKLNKYKKLELNNNYLYLSAFYTIVFIVASVLFIRFVYKVDILAREFLPVFAVEQILDYFMVSVTLIVVSVPEGLALAVTLSLAYSMRKLTKLNCLVRNMHAVETISAASVICSDKTGTLTKNEMVVRNLYTLTGIKEKEDYLNCLICEGVGANSTANLSDIGESFERVLGNPTEGALLIWLDKVGVNYRSIREAFKLDYQWTFNTERKFMASYGKSNWNDKFLTHVKGAPEIVLSRCSSIFAGSNIEDIEPYKEEIEKVIFENQSQGFRTIALAVSLNEEKTAEIETIDSLIWLGLFSLEDPLREDVKDAVYDCRQAGIEVKIVTGDTKVTARQIGKSIGLFTDGNNIDEKIIQGEEFRNLDDDAALQKSREIRILSRAKPLDKQRLVKLLQKDKHIVAVTGDGINDAPALNYADVGLSMGKTGTSVAKEASDIILLDDSFTSIVKAVMFGRSLYLNIQRFLLFQLIINVLALSLVFIGPFIGIEIMLTVPQMIWVNLIMDTFAAIALATQPPDEEVMKNKPRRVDDFIISKKMGKQIFIYGFIFLIVLTILAIRLHADDGKFDSSDSAIFFNTFVFLQLWNLFNIRSFGSNHSQIYKLSANQTFLFIMGIIGILQFLIIQYGGVAFRTASLNWNTWLIIIVATSPVLSLKFFVEKLSK